MNKKFLLGISLLTLLACAEQKIGYIDNGEVINKYQKKIDIEERFKIKEKAFQRKTDSISQAFQLEAKEFQLNSKKMSNKKAQESYEALGQKQQLIQQQVQFEQQQLSQSFQTKMDSVIKDVKDYVKDYGKTNGYTYILGTSEGAASVLYGTDDNNLTEIITAALNRIYLKKK